MVNYPPKIDYCSHNRAVGTCDICNKEKELLKLHQKTRSLTIQESKAQQEGQIAFENGEPITSNPYKEVTTYYDCWNQGWRDTMTELKDSGSREQFQTGAVRDTAENKSRPDLISPFFSERLGMHLMKGAKKYSEHNWTKGIPISRCLASLERHLVAFKLGMDDEDHASAIACNIHFIIAYQEMIKNGILPESIDDYPYQLKKNKNG